MSSAYSKRIRSFIAQSFIKGIKEQQEKLWTPSTLFSLGETFNHNGHRYIVTVAGLSGLVGPTNLQGLQINGTATVLYVERIKTQNNYQGNFYLSIGKNDEWADESSPDTPVVSDLNDEEYKANIISLKKVLRSEMAIGVPRIDWESGTVFDQYNEEETYTNPFYCITSANRVYKCINNNNGAQSVIEPTTENVSGTITLGDGYVWKYMFTVNPIDRQLFMTESYFPVSYKTENDGSLQWQVQANATQTGISTFLPITTTSGVTFDNDVSYSVESDDGSGVTINVIKNVSDEIQSVLVLNPGTGYTTAPYALLRDSEATGSGCVAEATIVDGEIDEIAVTENGTDYNDALVFIIGDGTGATATATIEPTGIISAITVDTAGQDYTWAKVFIIPGTVGVIAKGIRAPINGHGNNPVVELNASAIIINGSIPDDEHFLTGEQGEFRQIGLITDIKNQSGYAFDSAYIGPSHPEFSNPTSTLNKINTYSGTFLYLYNTTVVSKVAGQEEKIKIVIPI